MTLTPEAPAAITTARQMIVDGRLVDGAGAEFEVEDPAKGRSLATVRGASIEQVDAAISAGQSAFPGWAVTPATERAAALRAYQRALTSRRDEIVATLIAEAGTPRTMAEFQVTNGLNHVGEIADLAARLPEEVANPVPVGQLLRPDGNLVTSFSRFEPIGLVAGIAAYNAPFITAVWKAIPPLAVGCPVVLRPSPATPLTALLMAEAAAEAGLPAGVLNVVVEAGSEGAVLLTTHPGVAGVTFTGSGAVGTAVARQGADTLKRVVLELGGKSAQIFLPDAVERAPAAAISVYLQLSGQACIAGTRLLVPAGTAERVVEGIGQLREASIVIGDPERSGVNMGPLISDPQVARCERFVQLAVDAGGVLALGGRRIDGPGHFFEPTAIVVADSANPAAQEEIFGPVVTIQEYSDVEQAVAIANDSPYGLSGYVHGADLDAALGIARRIRSGAVNVNGSCFSAHAAVGAYKLSGAGYERGELGLRAFQELKHLVVGSA